MNILTSICVVGAMFLQAAALRADDAAETALASETQMHMGTKFTVQFYHRKDADPAPVMEAAFAKIHALDQMMTDYDPVSELSRLSTSSRHDTPVDVSPDLYRILERAREASEATDGAFDVTVGPITRLWRQARRQKKAPDDAKLKAALAAVGWKQVQLRDGRVQLTRPGMRLDLGGIAQGYAADEALTVLKAKGFSRAMVNASGDIRVGEPPPGKDGWKIGLTALDAKQVPSRFVTLKNAAISTSGDAFQFVEINGQRYSHIVDPATGLGLTTPMSVTVIAPDCTTADALASGLCVMGPSRAEQASKRWNPRGDVFVLFVVQTDEDVKTTELPGFEQFYEKEPAR
jgi:thiamine biosynthesis lipoprotein